MLGAGHSGSRGLVGFRLRICSDAMAGRLRSRDNECGMDRSRNSIGDLSSCRTAFDRRRLRDGCGRLDTAYSPPKLPTRKRRLNRGSLGDFRSTTHDDLNSKTSVAQHGDQGIDAEPIDLAPNEIADPRLRDAEQARGLGLREPATLNHLAEPNH